MLEYGGCRPHRVLRRSGFRLDAGRAAAMMRGETRGCRLAGAETRAAPRPGDRTGKPAPASLRAGGGRSFAHRRRLTARRRGYRAERATRPAAREVGRAFVGGIWALLFPVFLVLGLRMGVFTPSEIGAFAVVYALVIGVLVHRKMKAAGFIEGLEGSLADVGAVMFLIALSAIFSYGIVMERVPLLVTDAILGLTDDLYGAMILIAVFVLVIGFFVDATVLIIMLTPIFLPLVRQLGGDLVHFGIVFIVAATIGNFTPPVGAAMYAVCSILRCPIGEYTRESAFLFLAVASVTILLVFVPGLVLFLPRLIFG
ncbi:MAG TPA: TRAP transporter large permease [Geminicoccaceae bacterium]|nr:TRAP transporter large permease [Geminicoccaceae bacterium]